MEVEENKYAADVILLEKYQQFSAEILRLSLLGISVFGVMLNIEALNLSKIKFFVITSIVTFGLASAFSLAHRYYSSDGFHYQVRYLRFKEDGDKQKLKFFYKLSSFCIGASSVCLGVGAVALAIGFIVAAFYK